jgi:hypothetical protein
LARSPRLERGTLCLEGRCSIQLSYERNHFAFNEPAYRTFPDERKGQCNRAADLVAGTVLQDRVLRLENGGSSGFRRSEARLKRAFLPGHGRVEKVHEPGLQTVVGRAVSLGRDDGARIDRGSR